MFRRLVPLVAVMLLAACTGMQSGSYGGMGMSCCKDGMSCCKDGKCQCCGDGYCPMKDQR